MNEIKEIMNGNVKVFNVRIEGETIAFDTPYNSNWNFMPRDFEQIIDTLQQENSQLKERIDKTTECIEKQKTKMYKNRNKIALFVLMKLEKILKGGK